MSVNRELMCLGRKLADRKSFTGTELATIANFDNSPTWYDSMYGSAGWHDADYCNDDECRLAHRHDGNCRCADCYADDAE